MTDYKHIFFDLDHTLWDFHSNSIETLRELHVAFNLATQAHHKSPDYFIERYLYHNERMWEMYRNNRISKGRLRKARFETSLHDIGIDNKKLARDIGNAYIDICPQKSRLNDGAVDVVAQLAENFTLHILTNGFHETQHIKLSVTGLDKYFSYVITSEKASARKPSSGIFSYAERLTGATRKESLMIGDNFEIDVMGAVNFGWDALHYNVHGAVHDYPSVKSLREIPAYLGLE